MSSSSRRDNGTTNGSCKDTDTEPHRSFESIATSASPKTRPRTRYVPHPRTQLTLTSPLLCSVLCAGTRPARRRLRICVRAVTASPRLASPLLVPPSLLPAPCPASARCMLSHIFARIRSLPANARPVTAVLLSCMVCPRVPTSNGPTPQACVWTIPGEGSPFDIPKGMNP